MTKNTQSRIVENSNVEENLAQNVVEAYELAKQIASELSAILEAIETLCESGKGDLHVIQQLSSIGVRQSLLRMDSIDIEILSSNRTLISVQGAE